MLKELQVKLLNMNVNELTEKKNKLTYLSWSKAWRIVLEEYPEATYNIKKNPEGTPEFGNSKFGYMVYTDVTIAGVTREMWLFVMDGANKSMKDEEYTYQVKEYKWTNGKSVATGNMIDKTVEAISMFDINKTVMRCLVKNLAMFGLGLYIFAGEDLPSDDNTDAPEVTKKTEVKKLSEGQVKRLYAIAITKGYDGKNVKATAKTKFKVEELENLTKSQYDELCKGYENCEAKNK